MASSGKIEIEKFNRHNFELWKLKMEDLLVDKDQWVVVDPGAKPTRVSNEEWKKLDRKAKSTIRLCVSDSVFLNVSGEAMKNALWDKLGTLYRSKSMVNKLFLRKKLYNLMMKDGDSVTEHLNAINTMFDEIVSSLLTEEMRWKNMESHNEVKTTLDEGGDVYLASSSTHVDHEAWLIDLGASFHFTRHREWFCEYEKYDGGDVFLGDVRKARIFSRRKVKMKLRGGRVRTLLSVLHIPALAKNLISISRLDDAGVKKVFEKYTYKMVQGALILMRGVQIGTLYKLQGSIIIDGCNSSVVPESGAEKLVVSGGETMLWHQRLGHIREKGLRMLHGKGMVDGMSNSSLDFDFCENCVYGKQNRVSFPSGDDFSRNTWIYFLKKKSEAFDRFKEFKALVENQTEKKIMVLRTDNCGEFCSKEFEEFCKKCGIAQQKTMPYTPEKNGFAERMNKMLMERERCMPNGTELGQ
eukprot:PITA_21650